MTLRLHNFFGSSASTRLRAALNLKGLDWAYVGHHLPSGALREAGFLALNPQGLVPALELEDGTVLAQSLAIMEWLDETHPAPPLLPADPLARARMRALGYMIAVEIHPLNNSRVLKFLATDFAADEAGLAHWFRHWVGTTFAPLEQLLASRPETGPYCHGETPGLADCCLYAQIWRNRAFGVDLTPYPTIAGIYDALDALPAFSAAAPPNQPDAPKA